MITMPRSITRRRFLKSSAAAAVSASAFLYSEGAAEVEAASGPSAVDGRLRGPLSVLDNPRAYSTGQYNRAVDQWPSNKSIYANLSNRAAKIRFAQHVLSRDTTDARPYIWPLSHKENLGLGEQRGEHPFQCRHFARLMYYKYRPQGLDGVNWRPESPLYGVTPAQQKLRIPIREVSIDSPQAPNGHRINAVYLGGDKKSKSSWVFFEPQNDRLLEEAGFKWGDPGNIFVVQPDHDLPLDPWSSRPVYDSYAYSNGGDRALSKPLPLVDLPVFMIDNRRQIQKLDVFYDINLTRALMGGDADQFRQHIILYSGKSTEESRSTTDHIYRKAYDSGNFKRQGLWLIHNSIQVVHGNPESWNALPSYPRIYACYYMGDRSYYRKDESGMSVRHHFHRQAYEHLSSIPGLLTDGEKRDYLNAIEYSEHLSQLIGCKDTTDASRTDQTDAILDEAYKSDVLTSADKANLYQAEYLFRRIEGGFEAIPSKMRRIVQHFFHYRRGFAQSFGDSFRYRISSTNDLEETHDLLKTAGVLTKNEERAFTRFISQHS